MKRIVNSREMKLCDRNTIEHFAIPSLVLMERAALSVVKQIIKRLPEKSRILIVCGNGNNGADGLAAARILYQKKYQVCVVQMEDNGRRSRENIRQREILLGYGITILDDIPDEEAYHCVVDALFGIGLSRPLEGKYARWILTMNRLGGLKAAVDMPSGVSSDSGQTYEPAFSADLTVTFAYEKIGHLLYPARAKCGIVKTAQIGITDESWLDMRPSCYAPQQKDLKKIPSRPARSNKGTFGRVLVIAGSKNMAGAALFCAKAAYCTGCGLVTVLTAEENRIPIQTALPEAVLLTYSGDAWDDKPVLEAVERADVIALGPGLGTGKSAVRLTKLVLEHAAVPVVVDADGLNAAAGHLELFEKTRARLMITPHPGEMARLTGKSIAEIQDTLLETAREFAARYQLVCVLKDAGTVTACADGTAYINTSGCNAMAKGGSGDVLAGAAAGLLAQNMQPEEAAYMSVYIHGLAGEAAADKKGAYSVLASDLLDGLSCVLKNMRP